MREIVDFFLDLYEMEKIKCSRSLWLEEATVGYPWLITFSDRSNLGFSAVVYIRWELEFRGWWSTIVVSKCKIGPKSRLTIPRMELNGAVINKRITEFTQLTFTRKFERIIHLIDSSTVLGYLHKEDQKLKPFEGVRVAKIQASGQMENGYLVDWAWIELTTEVGQLGKLLRLEDWRASWTQKEQLLVH